MAACSLTVEKIPLFADGAVMRAEPRAFHTCNALYFKKHFEIFPGEGFPCFSTGNDRFGDAFFGILKPQDLLFNGILADQLICEYLPRLAYAVGSVCSLIFDSGVPPRVVVDDIVGAGEIEACTARFERNKEDGDIIRIIEAVHLFQTVFA